MKCVDSTTDAVKGIAFIYSLLAMTTIFAAVIY
jgi:hypothetical protein